jgi:uncharacterized caspase-like protein
MVVAFEEFYDKVKPGDELVVFYAGHGVQTERGAYLLPTDVEGDTQSQIEKMSYSVNGMLEELDRMKPRFSLVIVDACRDNPLRVRGQGHRRRAACRARRGQGPDGGLLGRPQPEGAGFPGPATAIPTASSRANCWRA